MKNEFILQRCTDDDWDRKYLEASLTSLKAVLTDNSALDSGILRTLLEFFKQRTGLFAWRTVGKCLQMRVSNSGTIPHILGLPFSCGLTSHQSSNCPVSK